MKRLERPKGTTVAVLAALALGSACGGGGQPARPGTIVPGSKHTALPAGAKVTFSPDPFPKVINGKGTTVSVTAKTLGGAIIADVDVLFEITEGNDKAITSKVDAGPDPLSTTTPPAHFVDTKLTSFTDATGTCTVTLIGTGEGDDALAVTVGTGTNTTTKNYTYNTAP